MAMYKCEHVESVGITDVIWQAILSNDSSFDGQFFYAVKTTGIFCRPSCKSRPPLKKHVRIFRNIDAAERERYRPCKRCKPEGARLPEEEMAAQIVQWIENNYAEVLTLETLAHVFHASPYHLHRTFKRIIGITPADFIQRTRLTKAMHYLTFTDDTIMDIALSVGIPNAAHFTTLFQKKTGLTPTQYRQLTTITVSNIQRGGVRSGANE